jgi:hypothetical protein
MQWQPEHERHEGEAREPCRRLVAPRRRPLVRQGLVGHIKRAPPAIAERAASGGRGAIGCWRPVGNIGSGRVIPRR